MARRYIDFPVDEEHKRFCDFMEYPLLEKRGDFYIYKIPHNHICRFLINYEKWKQGSFDKEKFIEQTKI